MQDLRIHLTLSPSKDIAKGKSMTSILAFKDMLCYTNDILPPDPVDPTDPAYPFFLIPARLAERFPLAGSAVGSEHKFTCMSVQICGIQLEKTIGEYLTTPSTEIKSY